MESERLSFSNIFVYVYILLQTQMYIYFSFIQRLRYLGEILQLFACMPQVIRPIQT